MNQLSTLADQHRHYSAIRARLRGPSVPFRVQRIAPPEPVLEPKPAIVYPAHVEPVESSTGTCPINMLAQPSWRFLVALAALRGGVRVEDVMGQNRSRQIMAARHDAIALIYSHQVRSKAEIGKMMGRDHTTIISSLSKRRTLPMNVEAPTYEPAPRKADPKPFAKHEPVERISAEVMEENRQLREMIGALPKQEFIRAAATKLKVRPSAARMLHILVTGKVRTREALLMAYQDPSRPLPSPVFVEKLISMLRGPLRRHGIGIENVWGEGWFMTPHDRAKVRELLGMEAGTI